MNQKAFNFSTPDAKRVLVTGSRRWTNHLRLEEELEAEREACFYNVIFILGDCPTGVDRMAREWCQRNDVDFERYEVDHNSRDRGRFHDRNQRMVTQGKTDSFLAFWDGRDPHDLDDPEASGTLDTMKRCVRAGLPGRIVPL